MKSKFLLALAISIVAYSQTSFAGAITDNYATGDKLTATQLNNIKSAVNDNDTRIIDTDSRVTAVEGVNTAQDSRITTVEGDNALQDTRITANEKAPRLPDTLAPNGTRMIVGCVDYQGPTAPAVNVGNSPDCGGGFVWVRNSDNTINIYFNTPFSGTPVVTATADILAGIYIVVANLLQPNSDPFPANTGFRVRVTDTNAGGDGVTAIAPFSFIAIGPN